MIVRPLRDESTALKKRPMTPLNRPRDDFEEDANWTTFRNGDVAYVKNLRFDC